MKQLTTALILATAVFAGQTFANTDLKGEVPITFYNWTGYYAGLNVGLVNHTMNITDNDASTFLATIQQVSNPRFTGGVQLGYRRQLDMQARVSGVYGAEISANFSNAHFQRQYGSPFALYQLSSAHALKSVCLLQLMGGLAADRTYLFLAAGAAWTHITGNTSNDDTIPFFNTFSVARNEWGTAIGAGIEYAFCDRFSARVKVDAITPHTYTTYSNTGNHFLIANSIMQGVVGVNYRFA